MIDGVLVKQWLYRDQLKPVAELDGSGNIVAEFIYGTKSNVPDLVVRGGNTYRIVSDQLESPLMVLNTTNSSDIQFQATYTAFGERTLVAGADDWMPFGFADGIYDPDTKLTRFGARDYDAQFGRWISKDPILFDGDGPNLYSYVLADPVNRIDDSGEGFVDCANAIAKYIACKEQGNRALDNRKAENQCPDKGHDKAIKEKNNRCEALRQKAFNACKDPAAWGPLLIGAGVGVALGIATGGGAVAVGVGAVAAM